MASTPVILLSKRSGNSSDRPNTATVQAGEAATVAVSALPAVVALFAVFAVFAVLALSANPAPIFCHEPPVQTLR